MTLTNSPVAEQSYICFCNSLYGKFLNINSRKDKVDKRGVAIRIKEEAVASF